MTPRPRARHEISAGGVVYRAAADGPLFLLIRDSYDNWGFPKGHLEDGEAPDAAALREVVEETGLARVELRARLRTIDWHFRFRGRLIHKTCHFFLMETAEAETCPQRTEGITACRWAPYAEAVRMISYANAREVLEHAHAQLSTGAVAADARAAGVVGAGTLAAGTLAADALVADRAGLASVAGLADAAGDAAMSAVSGEGRTGEVRTGESRAR